MCIVSRRTFVASLAAFAAYLAGGAGRFALATTHTFLKFSDIWLPGMKISEKAKQLHGKPVVMRGFMSPTPNPDEPAFVLTKIARPIPPGVGEIDEYPDDAILVRLAEPQPLLPYNVPIKTTGTLEVGTQIDEATNFVSRVRIVGAKYEEE